MALVDFINSVFGINLTLVEIYQNSSLKQLSALIKGGRIDLDKHLISLSVETINKKIVAFHAMSGSAVPYLPLSKFISPYSSFYCFEKNALDAKKDHSISEMASFYAGELIEKLHFEDLCLIGWSFGGLLAFEVVKILEAKGKTVELVLIDTPVFQGDMQNLSEKDLVKYFMCEYSPAFYQKLEGAIFSDLSSALKALLKKFSVKLSTSLIKILEDQFSMYCHHYRLLQSYKVSGYVDKLSVIWAARDKQQSDYKQWGSGKEWNKFSKNKINYIEVDSDHYRLLTEDVNKLVMALKGINLI